VKVENLVRDLELVGDDDGWMCALVGRYVDEMGLQVRGSLGPSMFLGGVEQLEPVILVLRLPTDREGLSSLCRASYDMFDRFPRTAPVTRVRCHCIVLESGAR